MGFVDTIFLHMGQNVVGITVKWILHWEVCSTLQVMLLLNSTYCLKEFHSFTVT